MRLTFVALAAFVFAAPSLKGQNWSAEARNTFAQTITPADLEAHLSFLAHDELEGRETGERGQRIASLYIRSVFMKAGLPGGAGSGSYFQPFLVSSTVIREATFVSGKKSWAFPESFIYSFRNAPTDQLDAREWVFVGRSKPGKVSAAGKLVMVLPPDLSGNFFQAYAQMEESAQDWLASGAAGVAMILPEKEFRTLQRYASRRSQQLQGEEERPASPVFYFSEKMAAELIRLAKGNLEALKKDENLPPDGAKLAYARAPLAYAAQIESSAIAAANVLAFLEGTEKPGEVLVITGHYDHIGIVNGKVNNGADDDGSGTSAVLEIAEAFALAAKEGSRPRRSILFMTVSGEEKGLWGSEFYAENPIYPLSETVANLNIDMIGRVGDEYKKRADSLHYVYLIGSDRLSTELHALSEAVNADTENLRLDYKYNDPKDPNRFYYRSDHYNFARKGIPIIFYFNGTHPDYHQPTDDIEKIQFGKMAKIARLVFATAWEVANAESRVVVDGTVEE